VPKPMAAVTVRDPLWDTIRVDPVAMRIVDTATFQRLRNIRQLGLAHLVYPGASHTRFDHALGVYHLAVRTLQVLGESGGLARVPDDDAQLIPFAALLHDIGHYPFSHALEELEAERIPGHHEALVGRFLSSPDIAAALEALAPAAPERLEALIRGASSNPLQGLVSGSLDLDKIEYLVRDARFCGVPYGVVDVDRLLHALMVLEDPADGRLEVGVHEKGVAALESLLFAKYQMFRNVYWHHAVRAATVMYKRIVDDALTSGLIAPEELVGQTDEGILFLLAARADAALGSGEEPVQRGAAAVLSGIRDLRARRLPKRAAEVVAAELDGVDGSWIQVDSALKRRVEERLAVELGLAGGQAYLDFPEKGAMFALHLLVRRRDGGVLRLDPAGRPGLIDLPRVAGELYRTARVLRLFTGGERRQVRPGALVALAHHSAAAIEERLASDAPLLGTG
jgi:uncharacterized protein